MRFFNRDGELDDRPLDRTYGAEARIAMSALDCALNGRKAVYGSSELTTGSRFYALARQHGVSSTSELLDRLGQDGFERLLLGPNIESANAFARSLEGALGSLVVTPGPFEAPGWSQPEYLAFWEDLIRTRVEAAYFNRRWCYSNGCSFELAVASDAGVPTFDHDRKPLDLASAAHQVRTAIADVEKWGFDPSSLRQNLDRIETIAAATTARAALRG